MQKRERRGKGKIEIIYNGHEGERVSAGCIPRERREGKLPERGEMARARGEEKGNIQYLVLYFCTYSPPTLM